jgi:dihydroxy-acid dehydratase
MSRSDGHCSTMGTASTMAVMVEALGLTLPGAAAIPAADSRRRRLAWLSGRRIVEMVKQDLVLSKILTREAFENAIKLNAAVGGSSNFVVHLLAIAGRIGVPLTLDDFDRLGSTLPLLVNLMPAGEFLMEEFFEAGGLPVVIQELREHLHMDALTVNGHTHAENTRTAQCWDRSVIRPLAQPLREQAGLAVLRGNLAPDGAIIKPSAASPRLQTHTGRAVVFEDYDDYHARIDSPDLDVTADDMLVLKQVGPKGYPGMPEVGNFHLPKKLLAQGVTDMIRISDGRMSGTAFGTVVLHVSPESAVGGALALVQTGDLITLDVPNRRLHLHVSEEVLAERRATWQPRPAHATRGYVKLYLDHVMGADKGADFDFLVGGSGGAPILKGNH